MATKGQKFKNYTQEIKEEIFRKYFEEYVPTTALSEEYGISKKTIQNLLIIFSTYAIISPIKK